MFPLSGELRILRKHGIMQVTARFYMTLCLRIGCSRSFVPERNSILFTCFPCLDGCVNKELRVPRICRYCEWSDLNRIRSFGTLTFENMLRTIGFTKLGNNEVIGGTRSVPCSVLK